MIPAFHHLDNGLLLISNMKFIFLVSLLMTINLMKSVYIVQVNLSLCFRLFIIIDLNLLEEVKSESSAPQSKIFYPHAVICQNKILVVNQPEFGISSLYELTIGIFCFNISKTKKVEIFKF